MRAYFCDNMGDLGLHAGAAAAWVDTVEAFGSGKLSVAEVLEPAICLATEGYKPYHRRASASLIVLDYRIQGTNIGNTQCYGSNR